MESTLVEMAGMVQHAKYFAQKNNLEAPLLLSYKLYNYLRSGIITDHELVDPREFPQIEVFGVKVRGTIENFNKEYEIIYTSQDSGGCFYAQLI